MKLLFVHETKIKEDKNGTLYTDGSYNQEVWNRYLSITSNLSIIARKGLCIYEVDDAEKRFNYFDKERINFIEVPNFTSSIIEYLDIRKRIKSNNIIKDAVLKSECIIARLPSTYGNVAIKFARKFNKPYLVEVVGCPWDALWNHSSKGKILAFPSWIAMKKSLINAPYAIYVTSEFLQKRYPTKGKSINCSDIVLTKFNDKVLEARLDKICNIKQNNKMVIGTTAAVNVRYKGQQYVIQALGKLKKQGITNFEYQIVGGGDQAYLKSIVERCDVIEQVKFLGATPHDKVVQWLDNIDLYIQPSMQEGLPRALIEALSRGLPSIGSDAGGIPELVSPEFVFKRKDVNDLEDIIKKMTKDTMLNEAKKNFEKAKEFDRALLDMKRNDFYRKFINKYNIDE